MKDLVISCCLGFAMVSGTALAEDKLPSTEDAIKELRGACERNPGYIATYHAKSDSGSLEYQVAADSSSGLAASHLTLRKGDKKSETRIWNTEDDRLHFDVDGELRVARGVNEEISSLYELVRKISLGSTQPSKPRWHQYLLLTETTVDVGNGFKDGSAPWLSGLDDSSVKSADPETITFDSKEKGMLTIDRKTGLVKRQSIKGSEGNDRILELAGLRSDPGRKAIEEMTRDWPTLGAKDLNAVPLIAPLRLSYFQQVIDSVARGGADLGKLETTLGEQKDATRHFITCCVASAPDSPALAKWRKFPLPEKEEVRELWLKSVAGAKAEDDEGFNKFLMSPMCRNTIRDAMVEGMLQGGKKVDILTASLFGGDVWQQLKTQDETGRAAKNLLGMALSQAFAEIIIERRMTQEWGDPEGLD